LLFRLLKENSGARKAPPRKAALKAFIVTNLKGGVGWGIKKIRLNKPKGGKSKFKLAHGTVNSKQSPLGNPFL